MGMLAPGEVDSVSSVMQRLDVVQWAEIEERFRGMERSAGESAGAAGADMARAKVRHMADMRYWGGASEITIPLPTDLSMRTVQDAVDTRYRALFSRTVPGAPMASVESSSGTDGGDARCGGAGIKLQAARDGGGGGSADGVV